MVSTNLRFDNAPQLFKAIKESAKQNRRSMNAEILRALEFYLKEAPEAHYETQVNEADKVVEMKKKKTK